MAIVQKKYIGLLGGSFDPAHKGHLGISKIAIKKFKLKKIYWVIAKKNPFKNKAFYSLDERIDIINKLPNLKGIVLKSKENFKSTSSEVIFKTKQEWINIFPYPDTDSFYFSDENLKQQIITLWKGEQNAND